MYLLEDELTNNTARRAEILKHAERLGVTELTHGAKLLVYQEEDSDGEVQNRIYLPKGGMRRSILYKCHDSRFAGHLGPAKTIAKLSDQYWWPSMRADATESLQDVHALHR